ncbi:MAG: hypothetical protein GWO07_04570 [Candidatus Dadabacteria bacterium]|nr:hypothetical protein [Candidatus Dadabacteria bacterium]NIS08036.1 hypothetical protein [Candidatus Dadabacteria bacterium]NIV40859.1 hypothetical protein [Candidatus Dadabacteria bacterium]NIY21614.1 hypothetical protein [Candidatus Dadabacteria bacterium]
MLELKTTLSEIEKALGVWNSVPPEVWKILWPLLLMTISSYPIIICISGLRTRFINTLDSLLLSLFIGLGYYTLVLSLLNAVLGIPVSALSFYILFFLTLGACIFIIHKNKIDWKVLWERKDWFLLAAMLAVVFFCGYTRFPNTLSYPDRLLDSDPYRHYPRTEAIVQTGDISRYEPHLAGQVPIFEVQGCYVLAAVISEVSGVDSWQVWKYGSLFMGILSIMAFYIFCAYFLPGRPRESIGIFASLVLAGIAVHITRTKMGFSVAWALPFLPLAFLMLLYSFRYSSVLYGCLFGLMFLFVGLSNMVPVSISVVFIFFYCFYEVIKRGLKFYKNKRFDYRDRLLKPFWGLAAGTLIFMTYILIWQITYAGASLTAISKGSSFENMNIMRGVMQREEAKEKDRVKNSRNTSSSYKFLSENIGWHNTLILNRYIGLDKLFAGIFTVLFFILYPSRRILYKSKDDDKTDGSWGDTMVFLLIILFVPLLHYCLLKNFMRPNTIEKEHLYNTTSILAKLKSDDPVIKKHLLPSLQGSFKSSLQNYPVNTSLSEQQQEELLGGLNHLIQNKSLFNESRKIPSDLDILRSKTRKLMENVQRGDDLIYINRLIIEDFFAGDIERRDLFGFIRIPTFTGRTYRYLIIPAFGLSLGIALFAYLIVSIASGGLFSLSKSVKVIRSNLGNKFSEPRQQGLIKLCLLSVVFIFISHNTLFSKGYGHWPPTSKPHEEKAFRWLSQNLPANSKMFAYWFQADFIGSYSYHAKNPVVSIMAGSSRRTGIRSNMWPPMEIDNLTIPETRSIADIKKYTEQKPGNYYVFKARFGPYIDFSKDPLFNLVLKYDDKKWGVVEIYELTTNDFLINKTNYEINE